MDSAPRSALRRPELVADIAPTAAPAQEAARVLPVTAVYQLSEAGRKASLLAGGDGRANQQLAVQVPISRLHLVSVDPKGVARLKLRPRFEMDAEQRVIRVDAAPTYDAPPTLEDLFREAARNHELERVYQAERTVTRAMKREAERERRAQIAQAFLADKTQRALVHPAPSPKRCMLATEHGRIFFDVATDEGLARDLPPEAHRRFRADLQAKKERNQQERAAQLALHEEKKRYVAAWIAKHGTPEQQERQGARVLPMDEAIEAITDHAFAAVADWPFYQHDGLSRLREHITQFPAFSCVEVSAASLKVSSSDAPTATAEEWDLVRRTQRLLPGCDVRLRRHRLSFVGHANLSPLTQTALLVVQKSGPFTLRREFRAS